MTQSWPHHFGLLIEKNQVWAANTAALVLFVGRKVNDRPGPPPRTHAIDTGAACGLFALQGHICEYAIHGTQGFDYDRARKELGDRRQLKLPAVLPHERLLPCCLMRNVTCRS